MDGACCTIVANHIIWKWLDLRERTTPSHGLNDYPVEKLADAMKFDVDVLIKLILEEISSREAMLRAANPNSTFAKVLLRINGSQEIVCMAALADQLKRIMKKDSVNPELREIIKSAELFSVLDPYWPSRWFLSVTWMASQGIECGEVLIPHQLWSLRQIEELCLNRGHLYHLPHYVGLLRDLRVLNVENNHLQTLPSSLQLCENLEELLVRCNEFHALPGFVLHMPKLHKISRDLNHFRSSYSMLPVQIPSEAEINSKSPVIAYCPETLRTLSAIKVARYMQLLTSEEARLLDIPRTLRCKVYEMLRLVSYCNHCGKGMTPSCGGYKVGGVLDSFLGYTHIPVEGRTCSFECAIEFALKLDKINLDYRQERGSDEEIFAFDVGRYDTHGAELRRSRNAAHSAVLSSIARLCRRIRRRLSRIRM